MAIASADPTIQALLCANERLQANERRRSAQLASAVHALESLSRSVSHDLRAPLRAIGSLTQILGEDHLEQMNAEGRGVLQVIQDGCRKMDQLITGLLSFSRANTQPLDCAAIDMTILVQEAVREVTTRYRAREHSLQISALPPSVGDPLLIREVWSQLLDNAFKYSSHHATLNISIDGRIEDGETIYRVQDNGLGFDMHYVRNLFGVFQRLHKPEDFVGAGVGLAIVQSIITRHAGRVWAQGAPNIGASFQFSLPIIDPSALTAAS